jgi:N-hydroxyarylamine O-acetyltransferase
MDVFRYLKRIGYYFYARADLETLRALMHCHVHHIPFENLDIYFGRYLPYDLDYFYAKVVTGHRGGYCYELNGLFYQLLLHLGFDVHIVSGRMARGKEPSADFSHMALVVTLDNQQWLVDVGFGDFALTPLNMNTDTPQSDGRNKYIVGPDVDIEGKRFYGVSRWNEARQSYGPECFFSRAARSFADFQPMHVQHQTSPDSYFTKNLMCSLPTVQGRISIVNGRIVETQNGIKRTRHIQHSRQLHQVLRHHFDIHIPAGWLTYEAVPVSVRAL